jgi:tRNA(Ile)-lysidine synthase TilS/MesJ
MLAHHCGDVEENVLSNVMHGMLPDALSGMRQVGAVEGCDVWRPLLSHRKDIIYDFAHTYGVP